MDKATATRKFEEPPDDIHDTDATFHVNKSHIDPQDELAHVRNEFLERIEQAKAEATKIEEEMGEQIEEARIAGKQAAFSDLEDDLYDRLSHTTMLATLHTMNEDDKLYKKHKKTKKQDDQSRAV
eukprot:s3446_g3.t1